MERDYSRKFSFLTIFPQPTVASTDIQRQIEKVGKAREKLAEALGGHRLVRKAERMRSQEERSENWMEIRSRNSQESER